MNIYNELNSLNYDTKKVFNLIHKQGPKTKNELSMLTDIKLTTLNRIIEPLEENRYIMQSTIGESTGGRRPIVYDIHAGKGYLVGVDISRTYTEIIITNLKIEILYQYRFNMNKSHSPSKTVATILEIIDTGLKSLSADKQKLMAIGIGTVGPLDIEKGVLINPAHFGAAGWQDVPMKELMQRSFECPVFVDNGANAAVLAEMLFGVGKGYKNLVYFHCGIGIRTGTISSETIIRTANNAEDAFGHMVIDVDGEQCACGNYGCIECYSSIHAITQKYISEVKKGRRSTIVKDLKDIHYMDICHAVSDGDSLAIEILTRSAMILGTGLANFINILNPGLVILSGPLINKSQLFYNVCTETAEKRCYGNNGSKVIFMRGGHFNDHAIAVGSAVMGLEHCLTSKVVK
ncbi:ROK family protein [Clostridium aminobutyricum]|uniref:ROK family protein n=1 Tax=Clostridium aminobutyricum TaxID=33953 RepID=A0A939D766_CLOAM|nr:ROK family protein [Clostridium aminobutyricum]MBN7772487.1 ROK family protein [Clostridium aminobutyricum]